ncbi:26S proteasome regulatory subunit S10B homolog B-like [Primulina tabacum]|uniref:26S proteasome regulatory subunit S10B homolog B-like n=1 Tax=Primulina tabacum TaxID=48773 RepID=UPI003F595393
MASESDDGGSRKSAIADYRKKLLNHKELEGRVRSVIVKASSGPRYVVGCRNKVDREKLTAGTRVVLDMTTLTIMRALPREVDPGNVSYSVVGGLSDQIRERRESIELPLMNPELFLRVGIKPPKATNYLLTVVTLWMTFMFIWILSSSITWIILGCTSIWTSWNWKDIVGQSIEINVQCVCIFF